MRRWPIWGISTWAACAGIALCGALLFFGSSAHAGARYNDPQTYCRAVGTRDEPSRDHRYAGPAIPRDLIAAVMMQDRDANAGNIVWRCAHGHILACVEHSTTACAKAPWVAQRHEPVPLNIRAVCRSEPDEACAPATHCIYQCRGGDALLNVGTYPVDERGYYPKEWIKP